MAHAILLIFCPDQKGITASITQFIYEHNGNIIHADQHIDQQEGIFFMRAEWDLADFRIPRREIGTVFAAMARKFQMTWELHFSDARPRMAIFVSRHLHCLYDLLIRHRSGRLTADIPLVVSNHPDADAIAGPFGVKFEHLPVTPETKPEQERRQIELLQKHKIDLIVLARYHQILSPQFVDRYPFRIINIHHSFLPAFPGKNPYAAAFRKGVNIIGATSHYVTAELDQGPIIEQDTVRISHRDGLSDLVRKGEDLEKVVLSRAVHLALAQKILCYNNKTVVFD